MRERADFVIDTGGLTAAMLRRRLADELLPSRTPGRLAVTLQSFGFKYGPSARRRPDAGRALPAQPPLRDRAAPADRTRPSGSWPSSTPTASLTRSTSTCTRCWTTCCPSICRGQGPPRGGDRLHGRTPPIGRDRRAPRGALRGPARVSWPRCSTATYEAGVIDHIGFEVSDLERSGRFYDAVFYALGRAADGRVRARGRLRDQRPGDLVRRPRPRSGARVRPRRAAGERQGGRRRRPPAGLDSGGHDDGRPAQRPAYGRRYYAGYLLDPDGLRVEIVSRR